MPYSVAPTASELLNRPYGGVDPFAPPGITDATKQGYATRMQGLASQGAAARDWSNKLSGFSASRGAGGNYSFGSPNFSDANSRASGTLDQYGQDMSQTLGGYGEAVDQTLGGAGRDIGQTLGQTGRGINQTLGQYGRAMGPGQINRIGASFNPWNPQLQSMIGNANQQLGRDFRQNVIPGLNRGLVGSGPGAYGGTRAGIAQGLREQGLANAMQSQTTQMAGQGYEAGLGRYVQDRQSTLANMLGQRQLGGQLGIQGAEIGGRLGMQGADLMGRLGMQGAQYGGQLGMQGAEQRSRIGMQGAELMNAQQLEKLRANAMLRNTQINAQTTNAQTDLRAKMAAAGLAQRGAGYNTDIGNSLIDFGGIQQGQNQQTANWYNKQYNDAQNFPQQRMDAYTRNLGLAAPGGQFPGVSVPGATSSENNVTRPQYNSPIGGAWEGARAGVGMYNDISDAWGGGGGGNPVPPGTSTPGYNTPGPFGY
jgi:hypothetical protein